MTDFQPPLSDHFSWRVKHLVTWRIIAEIMRRHLPRLDLRVYEMHPGGGQGDTLGLFHQKPGVPWPGTKLNDFRAYRRLGEEPRGRHRVHRLEEMGGYVWPYLRAEDPKVVVDEVEKYLGLTSPKGRLPAETPTIWAFRLMAELLGLAFNTRESLQWRSAYHDSSGMEGCFPRKMFLEHEHIAATVNHAAPEGNRYHRFWMLIPWETPEDSSEADAIQVIVDLAGSVWFGPRLKHVENIPELVKNRGSLVECAAWVWQRRWTG